VLAHVASINKQLMIHRIKLQYAVTAAQRAPTFVSTLEAVFWTTYYHLRHNHLPRRRLDTYTNSLFHSIMPSSQTFRLSACNLAPLIAITRAFVLNLEFFKPISRILRLSLSESDSN
jgi:hypothetical protein